MQQENTKREKLSLGELRERDKTSEFNPKDFERYLLFEKQYSPYNASQTLSLARRIRRIYGVSSPYCVEDAYRIREDLEYRGVKGSTIKHYLRVYEVLAEYDGGVLLKLKKPKAIHKIPNTLTSSEVLAIMNACQNLRDVALLNVLCYGALRRGEVSRLNMNDVEGRILHVRGATKTRRERDVVLTIEAARSLENWMKVRPDTPGNTALFITQYGDRLSGLQIYRTVKGIARRAGINKDITVHGLRHTAASTMLRSNMTPVEVAQMLGHSKVSTTVDIYCHTDLDSLKKSVDGFRY